MEMHWWDAPASPRDMVTGEDECGGPGSPVPFVGVENSPVEEKTSPSDSELRDHATRSCDFVLDFGKHKGQTLAHIYLTDRTYVNWMVRRVSYHLLMSRLSARVNHEC